MSEKKRVYICDRLRCYKKYGGECPDDHPCRHTSDRHHAANCPLFNPFDEIGDVLWERAEGWRKQDATTSE